MYKKTRNRMFQILNEYVDLFPEDGDVTIFICILLVLDYCSYLLKDKPLKKMIKLTRTEKEMIRDHHL